MFFYVTGINAESSDWFYSIDFYDKSSKIGIERCTRSKADRLTWFKLDYSSIARSVARQDGLFFYSLSLYKRKG